MKKITLSILFISYFESSVHDWQRTDKSTQCVRACVKASERERTRDSWQDKSSTTTWAISAPAQPCWRWRKAKVELFAAAPSPQSHFTGASEVRPSVFICLHFHCVSPCCGRDADANCTKCQPYLWDCWCFTNPLYPEVQCFVMSDILTKRGLQIAKKGYVTAFTMNSRVDRTTSQWMQGLPGKKFMDEMTAVFIYHKQCFVSLHSTDFG